jgi:trehalose-phosphatase
MKPPNRKFWDKIKKAGEPVLALDYDGTIAPFRVQRMEAAPLEGIPEALESIVDRGTTRLAVVSGRPAAELDELLGALAHRIILIGSHGWEWRWPGESGRTLEIDSSIKEALESAFSRAVDAMSGEPAGSREVESRVEKKTASVAVHVRGLEPEDARRGLNLVRAEWTSLLSGELELLEFNGGIEVRARSRDKGEALKELLERLPGSDLVVYIGDDVTDEDVFKKLPDFGIGIKVGEEIGETEASYFLPDCEEVREFLKRWDREVLSGNQGARP